MPESTVADILFEVLERPYYDGQSFTIFELLTIVRAENLFTNPPSAASIRLRLNHLIKVGKIIRVDSEHVVAQRAI